MSRKNWQGRVLEIGLSALTFLRLMFPSVNAIYEEEVMGFLSSFDLLLLFWIPVLNIFGKWMKKQNFPKWFPPTPVLILLASFVICAISGCLRAEELSWSWLVAYALGNGCLISVIAMSIFDICKGFLATQWQWLKGVAQGIIEKLRHKKEESK